MRACSRCGRELRAGDEAYEFDVERRIKVTGKTVTITDVTELRCPECVTARGMRKK